MFFHRYKPDETKEEEKKNTVEQKSLESELVEFVFEKNVIGHLSIVTRCLFYPSYERVVSCSKDGEIIIWNIKTWKSTRILENPSGIRSIIEWSDKSFLSIDKHCSIFLHSFDDDGEDPDKLVVDEIFSFPGRSYERLRGRGSFHSLIRVTPDLILCTDLGVYKYDSELPLISLSSKTLVRNLLVTNRIRIHREIRMVNTKFEGCVFMGSFSQVFIDEKRIEHPKSALLFINCIENRIEHAIIYSDLDMERIFSMIYSLQIFTNKRNQDVMVVGGYKRIIYVYTFPAAKKPSEYIPMLQKQVNCKGIVRSLFIFEKYLLASLDQFLELYDIELGFKKIKTSKFERKYSFVHNCVILEKSGSSVKLCGSGYDHEVKIFRISGLSLHDEGDQDDLIDRLGFLHLEIQNNERNLFDVNLFFHLKLRFLEIDIPFRWLLLI